MKRAVALLLTAVALIVASEKKVCAGYTFDLGNSDIQGVTGPSANQLTTPYATLSIVGDTVAGTVTFTLATSVHNSSSSINAVFSEISFDTKLDLGTDFTLASVNGKAPDNKNNIASGSNAAMGKFDYTVGSASSRASTYTFVLNLNDSSQALASNFAVANSDNNYFAAHMFTSIGGNGTTGFISVSPHGVPLGGQLPVPAPPTTILVLLGLPGFAAAAWARRRNFAMA